MYCIDTPRILAVVVFIVAAVDALTTAWKFVPFDLEKKGLASHSTKYLVTYCPPLNRGANQDTPSSVDDTTETVTLSGVLGSLSTGTM